MKEIWAFRSRLGLVIGLFFLLLSCSSETNFEEPPIDNGGGEEPQGTFLPRLEVQTRGTIVDEPKIRADLVIRVDGQIDYDGPIGIEFRGASSQSFDKKSYGVETWTENNEDVNVSLLGMPEEEDWVLHGPYSDKSLIRNKLIYDLARDMDRYASRTRMVELFINGVYQGVYVFMEKLKRNKDRIAINKLRPDENSGSDVTGGYILKIDKVAGSNLGEGYNDQNSFASQYKPAEGGTGEIRFLYEYPDAEEITGGQKNYIQDYMHGFETALKSDQFADEQLGYKAYADMMSFVDFFILNELSHNVDGYRLSTYMHKDKNGKLVMGPIWDFNLGFGNAGYCGGSNTHTWAYKFNERCPGDYWNVPFWWHRLLEDPAFVEALKSRWNALRAGALATDQIHMKIDGYVKEMRDVGAVDRNFGKWQILGQYVWPNSFIANSHEAEIIYVKTWVRDRMAWLDAGINGL